MTIDSNISNTDRRLVVVAIIIITRYHAEYLTVPKKLMGIVSLVYLADTRSSAIAEKPRDAECSFKKNFLRKIKLPKVRHLIRGVTLV